MVFQCFLGFRRSKFGAKTEQNSIQNCIKNGKHLAIDFAYLLVPTWVALQNNKPAFIGDSNISPSHSGSFREKDCNNSRRSLRSGEICSGLAWWCSQPASCRYDQSINLSRRDCSRMKFKQSHFDSAMIFRFLILAPVLLIGLYA